MLILNTLRFFNNTSLSIIQIFVEVKTKQIINKNGELSVK